jgi:hypothetical protein
MDYLTNYYKNLCEQLQEKINLLEAKAKKKKKAKKDYDGDGKVESSTDEWKGSRDRAIKQAMSEENLNELFILDPNQKFASEIKNRTPAVSRLQQGTQRADVLGKMMALASYDNVNADEKAAIQRIIADTQQSAPASTEYRYGNFQAHPPLPQRKAGSAASIADVRTALRGLKNRQNDPKFSEHLTSTIANELTPTTVKRAYDVDSTEDYQMFGARQEKKLRAVSDKNAKAVPVVNSPTQVTTAYGNMMFDDFPADRKDLGDKEYTNYFPMDLVTRMVRKSGRS